MNENTEKKLGSVITPAGAMAFALGTSLGWGTLIVTANTYLSNAGPAGSVIGLIIGGLIMLAIGRNYYYMMNCYPEAGGAYAFTKDVYGHDHGFLTAWFLMLTYLAMLWANFSAVPLFVRYFFGNIFRFGYLYSIFGYDVYFGEILLTVVALLLASLICARFNNAPVKMMIGLAALFTFGIIISFIVAILNRDHSMEPLFTPDSTPISQIIRIACISPWAFIGFENMSHFTEEFSFPRKKTSRLLTIVVIVTTVLYIFVMVLSVTAYPLQYGSWLEYIRDLGNLSGLEALPAFYAARYYLGQFGVNILIASVFALVVTSLFGNILTLSRLFYSMACDGILPQRISVLNEKGIPANAIRLIFILSVLIPLLGRTAIGWIVDVTTLGATIIYALVSACTVKMAREQRDRPEEITGIIGLIAMIFFLGYTLLPNLISTGTMETPSYILFVVWSLFGFIFFRWILSRDEEHHFGKSIIVWIGLLSLILFVSLVWMSQSTLEATNAAMIRVENHFIEQGYVEDDSLIVSQQINEIRQTNARSILVVILLFGMSLGVLLNNYSVMSRRAQESENQLAFMSTIANTDPLTGVKSKHAYTEKEKTVNEAIENGDAEAFALVICDVNGLKYINDTYGHKTGDMYIQAASKTICELFGHSPVYRTGGDEFVVYLVQRDYENRHYLMQTLHQRSVENIGSKKVVISAGLSEFVPEKDKQIRDVFERADKFMYEEKQSLKKLGARIRQ